MSSPPNRPLRTRLAPSPTGALHLGNARTFLMNWALARQNGWRILLRIEDLDSPRVKPGADRQAIEDLSWLGIDWDEGPSYQLADLSPYQAALDRLRAQGLTYVCSCTRSEIAKAPSAPQEGDHELRYPGTCRPKTDFRFPIADFRLKATDATGHGDESAQIENNPQTRDKNGLHPHPALSLREGEDISLLTTGGDARGLLQKKTPEPGAILPGAWRVVVPDEVVVFEDRIRGQVERNVQQQVGDFVVATRNGLPAYQLAVVVDDARQGITEVVRGDDLLDSTARQIWLYRFLELGDCPRWWHLPLVRGPDGRRLAKRHGDTRIASYRQKRVPPERIVGLLAYWSGVSSQREPMTAADFCRRWRLEELPRTDVTFTVEDEAWLWNA
ncbi:MAG: hypothetical protein IT443_09600 [Phycisphaeraceae bacterium]|nr:hypothetical protein [Phycisphaeraceae bacterium]